MEWYKRGKAAVTNGSTKVVCSTASFVGNIERGEAFVGPDARHYEIAKVISATEITIARPYAGATTVGNYDIIPVQGYPRELAHAAANIIESNRSIEKNTEDALAEVRESVALSMANIALVQSAADSVKAGVTESGANASRSLSSANKSEASAASSSSSAAASSASADTAKKWATQTTAEVVTGQGYGAKYYADKSASSATAAEAQKTAAAGSATAAKSSETAAKTSQTASASSATAAKTSETAAKASETAAAASAGTASTKATEAATSATASETYKTASANSATAAKASETAAKASQVAAKTSETTTAGMVASVNDTAAAINANVATANTAATNAKASETAAKASETAAKTSETAAKASQTAAASSASGAETNKLAAAGSASNAATSATAAKASETAALAHKNAAGVSAAAAKTSETTTAGMIAAANDTAAAINANVATANTAATNAKASETAAANSAAAAKTSETAAKTSQTAAAGSASTAATKATEAATSATASETHKSAAGVSAAAAKASETAAKASETAAKASQAAASASQTAAKTSETAANASETAAAGSATSAASSATAAKASETAAKTSQTAAAGSATSAATKAAEAATSASASETHKNASGVSAAAAKASETAAKSSETKSAASAADAKASESKSAASAASARESERLVADALAGMSNGVSDLGAIDLSGGQLPAPPVLTSIWTVSVAGTVAGDYYAVGDQLYYSAVSKSFTHVGNAGGVKTLSGKRGDLTVEDVLPAGANGQVLKHNGSKWIAGTDNNTTYSGMTSAEATAASSTTQRLVSPSVLKEAILHHAPPVPAVAPSATKLQTARSINGTAFDGTQNIEVDARVISITAGTGLDMNNYKTPGFYSCPASAVATTIANCPTAIAFALLVENAAGAVQTVTEYTTNTSAKTWRRHYYGTWGAWYLIYSENTPQSSVTGNAGTATKLATARTITIGRQTQSFDGSANIAFSAHGAGMVNAGGGTGQGGNAVYVGWATSDSTSPGRMRLQIDTTDFADQWPISIRYNAATATKLQTARTINGVSFDGSSNININGFWGGNLAMAMTTAGAPPDSASQGMFVDGIYGGSTQGYPLAYGNRLQIVGHRGSEGNYAANEIFFEWSSSQEDRVFVRSRSERNAHQWSAPKQLAYLKDVHAVADDVNVAAAKKVVLADHADSYLMKTVSNVTGVTSAIIRAQIGGNDAFRIGVGATATNAGYAEIATADDGSEPIYVRQYTGVFSTIKNELALLDAGGNSSFPGRVYSKNGFFSQTASSYVTALQAGGSVLDGVSATAGQFVPFVGSRTTNGGIGIAAHKDYIEAFFVTKANIDAGTNSVSKSVILMNENGDGTWAGKVSASSFKGDGSEVTGLNAANVSSGTLAVERGGTGVTSATGTGSVVLSTSPALAGTPTAPTATDGTNTTQLATTAFVQNAVGGVLSKTVTGGTVTLTDVEASNPVISFNGTLTSNLTVVVPSTTKRLWSISNQTSGSFSLTVKTASGTGVTVAQAKRNLVFTEGYNVYDAFNDFESIALTGVSTAPTASTTTNTTQIATTAFVQAVNSADTGSSATAVKLKTARTINGVSFDGTANITVADSTKLPLTGGTITGELAVSNTSSATTTNGLTGALRTLGGLGVKGVSVFGDRIGVGAVAATNVQLDVLQSTVAANSSPFGARILTDVANGALTASRSSYGQYTRIRSYLTYANGKALGFNMTTVGGHFEAQDSIAGAHTQELYGLRGYAIVTQSTGGTASDQLTGRIEGVRGYALLSAADQTASAIVGSYHYAHLSNATAIATSMTGVEAYVRNQAGTVTGNSYAFRGAFSGTFAGARYGIYITGASVNQMDGYLALVGNVAATSTTTGTLRVTGGAGFTGQVHAAGFTGNLTGNATSATKLATAQALTIGGVSKNFDGSAAVSWTLEEIGAQATLPAGTNGQVLKHNGTNWVAGTDNNTTYGAMSAAEANAGTATSNCVITAAVLKGAIETHAPTPTTITGNAGSATKLATARTINGVSFDGTANITVADATKLPLTGGVLSGSLDVNGAVTGRGGGFEIYHNTPHIDFHFGNSTADYTSRLIETTSGTLTLHGSFVASGNVTAYSDRRLKSDIRNIKGAMAKVQKLNGVTYRRTDIKNGKKRKHAGLIAQDVKAVLPEAIVVQLDEQKTLTVNYNGIVGLLVEAIKELNVKVGTLEGLLEARA